MLVFLLAALLIIIWCILIFYPAKRKETLFIGLLLFVLILLLFYVLKRRKDVQKMKKQITNISYYHNYLKQIFPGTNLEEKLSGIPIFVINLPRSEARRKFIEKQIVKYKIPNIKFVDGVDGKKLGSLTNYFFEDVSGKKINFSNNDLNSNAGEVGCTLSHFKAIKECHDKKIDLALICEDDVSFSLVPFWDHSLREILQNAPEDWELIYLIFNCPRCEGRNKKRRKNKKFISYVKNDCWGSQAYLINKKGIQTVIDKLTLSPDSIFLDVNKLIRKRNNAADILIPDITKSFVYTQTLFPAYNDNGKMGSLIHTDHNEIHFKSSLKALRVYYKKILQRKATIPKKLHLIWIGPNKPPVTLSTWTQDFAKSYPDWEVKVWGNEDIENLRLANKKEYDNIKQYAGKADIARYEILYRFGGMYIDADAIWLGRPLDPRLFAGRFNVFRELDKSIANTWIATVPKHPFLKEVIKRIPGQIREKPTEDPWIQTGPRLFHEIHEEIKDLLDPTDFNLVEWDLVLCPSKKDGGWHGMWTEDEFWKRFERCRNSKAFCFHWGLTTNKFKIDPGKLKRKLNLT